MNLLPALDSGKQYKEDIDTHNNILTGISQSLYPKEAKKNFNEEMIKEMISMGPGEGVAVKGIGQALKYGQKAYDYLSPHKEIPKFMEKLGEGAKTIEENVANIAQDIGLGRISKEEQALKSKRDVLNAAGNKSVNPTNYLTKDVSHGYSSDLLTTHNKFVKTPNAQNADKLLSDMKAELRNLPENPEMQVTRDYKQKLKKNISNLTQDFEDLISELPSNVQGKYKEFTQSWKESKEMYHEQGKIMKELSKLNPHGISKSKIASTFSNPTKETIKILAQVNPKLKERVMFNLLENINPKDVDKFANAILDAKKSKGYSQYVTKDMEKLAHNLLKRKMYRTITEDVGLGLIGSIPFGPLGGAAMIGARHGLPHLAKGLKMFKK